MNRQERFNAKARRSSTIASSHKRGKQRRPKKQPAADTNAEIVQSKSAEEKELDRKEQLRREVRFNPLHTIYPGLTRCSYSPSPSQRRRARRGRGWISISCVPHICSVITQNAYTNFQEKKLKKEERLELFEKLAWVQGSVYPD